MEIEELEKVSTPQGFQGSMILPDLRIKSDGCIFWLLSPPVLRPVSDEEGNDMPVDGARGSWPRPGPIPAAKIP